MIAANLIRGYNPRVHRHLRRIPVLLPQERTVIYFVTLCTASRLKVLANAEAHGALLHAWTRLEQWKTGRYVIMPDHVHFFVSPRKREAILAKYVQALRSLVTRNLRPLGYPYPLWQREFFDHLLRAGESYEQKWNYVFWNPVRHGLVQRAEDWPYAGQIHSLTL